MNLAILLMEDSNYAIEYFRNNNLEEAYIVIDDLRKKAFFEGEACFNLRVDFEDLGLRFDEVIGDYQRMMSLFDMLQIRICQLKSYYETEARLSKDVFYGRFCPRTTKPVWRF